MGKIIPFEERSKRFAYDDFIMDYKRMTADKSKRASVMLLGFYTRQLMEHGVENETAEQIYSKLSEEYKYMLTGMVNEQIIEAMKIN